ncbi:MAG: hypothetical protein K2N98_10020 [Lachnospiraceae bacterium]|nr:hypothetical protein [Lachnospiraceae bacterium]
MEFRIEKEKGNRINEGMIGLFFEDINYAADGGLYAEMIENRSFEFYDCYGDKGDYYVKPDPGYGWSFAQVGENSKEECRDGGNGRREDCGSENRNGGDAAGELQYVMGSPLYRENPHYLRFTAAQPGQGIRNQAYSGIYLEKEKEYKVSFYARQISYEGKFRVTVRKEGFIYAEASVPCQSVTKDAWRKWIR